MKTHLFVLFVVFLFTVRSVYGVERCYYCIDQCEDLQVHECADDGQDIALKCYTIEILSGETSSTEKGCLPADVLDTECAKANQYSGTTCSICDTDLCNGRGSAVTSCLSTVLLTIICVIWKFFSH